MLRPYRNAICRGLSQCFLQDLRGLLLHVGEHVCRRSWRRVLMAAIAYRYTRKVCSTFVLWSGNGHNGTRDEDKIGERESHMKKQASSEQPSEAEGPHGEAVTSRSALLLTRQAREEGGDGMKTLVCRGSLGGVRSS